MGGCRCDDPLGPGDQSPSGPRRADAGRTARSWRVRRYVGCALIAAIALIAGFGIGYVSFYNDFRRSPVTSSTEARSGDDRVTCQVEGHNVVTGPNLIGKRLSDATAGHEPAAYNWSGRAFRAAIPLAPLRECRPKSRNAALGSRLAPASPFARGLEAGVEGLGMRAQSGDQTDPPKICASRETGSALLRPRS